MAGRRTLADLEREFQTQSRIWRNAEPGSAESDEARHRVQQTLAVLHDEYAREAYIRILAEWEEIRREKRIEQKRREHRRNRCSVMAVGGDIFKDNLFGIGDYHNTRLRH
jgi:hypothetical protein